GGARGGAEHLADGPPRSRPPRQGAQACAGMPRPPLRPTFGLAAFSSHCTWKPPPNRCWRAGTARPRVGVGPGPRGERSLGSWPASEFGAMAITARMPGGDRRGPVRRCHVRVDMVSSNGDLEVVLAELIQDGEHERLLIERLSSWRPHQLSPERLSKETIPTRGPTPGSVLLRRLRTLLPEREMVALSLADGSAAAA